MFTMIDYWISSDPLLRKKTFKKLCDCIFAVSDLADFFPFFKSKAFILSLLIPCSCFITVRMIYGQCCSFLFSSFFSDSMSGITVLILFSIRIGIFF